MSADAEARAKQQRDAPKLPFGSVSVADAADERARRPPESHANAGRSPVVAMVAAHGAAALSTTFAEKFSDAIGLLQIAVSVHRAARRSNIGM